MRPHGVRTPWASTLRPPHSVGQAGITTGPSAPSVTSQVERRCRARRERTGVVAERADGPRPPRRSGPPLRSPRPDGPARATPPRPCASPRTSRSRTRSQPGQQVPVGRGRGVRGRRWGPTPLRRAVTGPTRQPLPRPPPPRAGPLRQRRHPRGPAREHRPSTSRGRRAQRPCATGGSILATGPIRSSSQRSDPEASRWAAPSRNGAAAKSSAAVASAPSSRRSAPLRRWASTSARATGPSGSRNPTRASSSVTAIARSARSSTWSPAPSTKERAAAPTSGSSKRLPQLDACHAVGVRGPALADRLGRGRVELGTRLARGRRRGEEEAPRGRSSHRGNRTRTVAVWGKRHDQGHLEAPVRIGRDRLAGVVIRNRRPATGPPGPDAVHDTGDRPGQHQCDPVVDPDHRTVHADRPHRTAPRPA